MANIFFITGACGTGKSSIINFLKKSLNNFEIYDFDEVGVPDNPPLAWRHNTTKHWLKVGKDNLEKNKSTIVCGLTIPQEIEKFMLNDLEEKIYIMLLDVSNEEREKRLKLRNADQDLIDELDEVIGLRKWVPESRLEGKNVINTTKLSIEEVASEVKKLILQESI